MKKSGYVFFGIIGFLLILPFWTGWVYPEIQHSLHTREEQVQQITALVEDYMEEKYPDANAEIIRINYNHHARHYYVDMIDQNDEEFSVILPEKLDAVDIDRLSDSYAQ